MPSDTSNTGDGEQGANGGQQPTKSVPLYFTLQYIKDLSFENPRAPEIYDDFEQPDVDINVNVGARALSERSFEVILRLSVDGKAGGQTSFLIELEYAGIAQVGPDIEPENIQPLVLIEGPRMLFPFARAIIANLTRDAAFPLLLLGQMDFITMYREGMAQAAAQGANPQL